MNRKQFIKTSLLLGGATFLSGSFTSIKLNEDFTLNQLIGKGNPDLTGNTYLTTMHKETALALQKMKDAAAKDNISLEVVSAYRSFQRQKEIFESKFQKFTNQGLKPLEAIEKIIEYSTIPGTSRHHWGTDLDLIDANAPRPNDVLVAKNFYGEGPYCKMKEWMQKNATHFGFYEVYTDVASRKGFKHEPWHFSYAPVAIPMLKAFKKLDLINILKQEKIKGSDFFTNTFIEKYRSENILDINPELL